MNNIFKVIWNQATQSWTAVSELGKAHKKTKSVQLSVVASALILGANGALAAATTLGTGTGEDGTIAISNTDAASAGFKGSIAIGNGATVDGSTNSVAIGTNANVGSSNKDSVVIGYNASTLVGATSEAASGEGAVAVGSEAKVNGTGVAVGIRSNAAGYASQAIGQDAKADNIYDIAIGVQAHSYTTGGTGTEATKAPEYRNVALGVQSTAKNGATALGDQAFSNEGVAVGNKAAVLTQGGVAVGRKAESSGSGVALGERAVASKHGSVSAGYFAQATGESAYAVGFFAEAKEKYSIAIGRNAKATAESAFAIGGESKTDIANSVAIGTKSTALTGKDDAVPTSNGVVSGQLFENFAAAKPVGVVSVGAKYVEPTTAGEKASVGERQIKNVAAGQVTATSTDAINGSQLYSLSERVINYAHVNTGAENQYAGEADTNKGFVDAKGGATGLKAIAIGVDTKAAGENAVAMGNKAKSGGLNGVSIGYLSGSDVDGTIAIGEQAGSGITDTNSIRNIAIGYAAGLNMKSNDGKNDTFSTFGSGGNVAVGVHSGWNLSGDSNVTIGSRAGYEMMGDNNIVMGHASAHKSKSTNTVILGSQAGGEGSTNNLSVLIGNFANGNNKNGTAAAVVGIGPSVMATGAASVALGAEAQSSVAGSVALGATSVADKVAGIEGYKTTDRTNNYANLKDSVLTSTTAGVSVGAEGKTRQIHHVAAGTADDDAVNVAQLRNVNLKVAGNAGNGDVLLDSQTLTIKGDDEGKYVTTKADNNDVIVDLSEYAKKKIEEAGSNWDITTSASEGEVEGASVSTVAGENKTVTVDAGKNIKVTQSGNKVSVATKANVEFDKTISKEVVVPSDSGNVVINKDGINAGNKVISNVAPGVKDTDAVNVSQLKTLDQKIDNVSNRVNKLDKDMRAGIAGAHAAAGLPQVMGAGKSMVAATVGTFKGESAVAVGYSRASDNGKVIIKLQGSGNSRGDVGGSVGMGYQW